MTLPIQLETKQTEELIKSVAIELSTADDLEHFTKVTKDEHIAGNDGSNNEDNEQASP